MKILSSRVSYSTAAEKVSNTVVINNKPVVSISYFTQYTELCILYEEQLKCVIFIFTETMLATSLRQSPLFFLQELTFDVLCIAVTSNCSHDHLDPC